MDHVMAERTDSKEEQWKNKEEKKENIKINSEKTEKVD
jgi:hypothetical protein